MSRGGVVGWMRYALSTLWQPPVGLAHAETPDSVLSIYFYIKHRSAIKKWLGFQDWVFDRCSLCIRWWFPHMSLSIFSYPSGTVFLIFFLWHVRQVLMSSQESWHLAWNAIFTPVVIDFIHLFSLRRLFIFNKESSKMFFIHQCCNRSHHISTFLLP